MIELSPIAVVSAICVSIAILAFDLFVLGDPLRWKNRTPIRPRDAEEKERN